MKTRYVIHRYKNNMPHVVEEESSEYMEKVLCDEDTYKDGITVNRFIDGVPSYHQLLRGSKLAFDFKGDSCYGYEHAVAFKIGKIAGERFNKNPELKATFIETKVKLMETGNYSTRKKIFAELRGGVYRFYNEDVVIYRVDGGFLFVNLKAQHKKIPEGLVKQTIHSLINTYYPDARKVA